MKILEIKKNRNILNQTYSISCKRLGEHFTSGRCRGSEYTVQIVEQMSGNGRLANGKVDLDIQRERKKREDGWMLKLRSVYPYGLNDGLNSMPEGGLPYASREGIDGVVGKLFPALPRQNSRVVRSRSHYKKVINVNNFMSDLKQWLSLEISSAAFYIRTALSSASKNNLKNIALKLHDFLSSVDHDFMYFLWYRMALDLIETKMYKPRAPKAVKSIPNYKITIPFVNKALDYINLPQILRSNEVKSNIPDLMEVLDIPMIVHCLKPSIRSRVLNYKKFVKNLDLKSFCRSQKSIPCHCREYNIYFVDPNAKHVLTGDLNIIKNNKLRKLLSKGPKYREPVKIDWMEARFLLRTH